jgi:hypothetical protein
VQLVGRDGTVAYNKTTDIAMTEMIEAGVPVSGDYKIVTTSSGIHAYGLVGKAIANAATLTPTIVTVIRSTDGQALFDGEGMSHIWFEHATEQYAVDLSNITTKVGAITAKVATMQTTANNFAQAYYNTLIINGGDDNRVMPDIVFPDPENLDQMTYEQVYGIYLTYLTQQQAWFQNYTVQSPDPVNISQESLHLKVRGQIWDASGHLLYSNVTVFTPYISLDDMDPIIGNNTMTQPGFVIIWGESTSLDALEHLTNISYIPIQAGYVLKIEEM